MFELQFLCVLCSVFCVCSFACSWLFLWVFVRLMCLFGFCGAMYKVRVGNYILAEQFL
eukprot:m.138584 g.138584  ORF g.138584 m.138584 type:complete len:58 (+) comp24040_c2_seq2:5318-5491(+)